MKKIVLFIVALVSFGFSTERVNITCKFDAIAKGYKDKIYSSNMILVESLLLNEDGELGVSSNAIHALSKEELEEDEDFGWFGFVVTELDRSFSFGFEDSWKFGKKEKWELNIGNIECVMRHGWLK